MRSASLSFLRMNFIGVAAAALLFGAPAVGAPALEGEEAPTHALPLDLSGAEYARLLARPGALADQQGSSPELDSVLAAGKRNLDWLDRINGSLPQGKKLSFSSPGTVIGYPAHAPLEYNESIALERFKDVASSLPLPMKSVLIDGAPLTDRPPIATADYLSWGRKIDRVYQLAARWRLMQPVLASLAARRWKDVRGHLFMEALRDRDLKLRVLGRLSPAARTSIEAALIGLCINARETAAACRSRLQSQLSAGPDASAFYLRYAPSGAAVHRSFFEIPAYAARRDLRWSGGDVLVAPFADPIDPARRQFALNIEDEWRFAGFRLLLGFRALAPGVPRMTFVPGVTPHVDRLGGDEITMDANAPLTEYDVQWTIRHEFGHVLGFPDCYHEFYQSETSSIVSYQIDVSDLMCSRKGKMNSRIEQEMRRVY